MGHFPQPTVSLPEGRRSLFSFQVYTGSPSGAVETSCWRYRDVMSDINTAHTVHSGS